MAYVRLGLAHHRILILVILEMAVPTHVLSHSSCLGSSELIRLSLYTILPIALLVALEKTEKKM